MQAGYTHWRRSMVLTIMWLLSSHLVWHLPKLVMHEEPPWCFIQYTYNMEQIIKVAFSWLRKLGASKRKSDRINTLLPRCPLNALMLAASRKQVLRLFAGQFWSDYREQAVGCFRTQIGEKVMVTAKRARVRTRGESDECARNMTINVQPLTCAWILHCTAICHFKWKPLESFFRISRLGVWGIFERKTLLFLPRKLTVD